jgi:hypothetical protein
MADTALPSIELRPLGLGELLDRTFTLYRSHFWLFCGVMAFPQAVRAAIDLFAAQAFAGMPLIGPKAPTDPRQILEAFQATAGRSVLLSLVALFIYGMAIGATTFCIADVYQRRSSSIRSVYQQVSRKIAAMVGLFVMLAIAGFAIYATVVFVAVFVAALAGRGIALVSPAVAGIVLALSIFAGFSLATWLLMRFAVSLPVLLVEDTGVLDSMARSGRLTAGNRGRVFLALVVTWLIVLGVTAVFTMLPTILTIVSIVQTGAAPLWAIASNAILGAIAGMITGPFLAITLSVLYFDLRIRKEAFDLESLMSPPAVPEIPPAPLAS